MKRLLLLLALSSAVFIPFISANESAELFRRLYFDTESVSQRLGFMEEIIALNDPSTGPILADALGDLLLASRNVKDSKEREVVENLARLISAGLGTFKYTAAATDVFTLQEETKNPLLKAEAIIALGRMRSLKHARAIADILRSLNNEPTQDKEVGEKIAYGCIISLEKMRSPEGFQPVFYSIDGWYTKRVRDQAERSLASIMEDPTEQIMKILETDVPSRKLYAIKHELKSKASKENQVKTGIVALKYGFELKPRDKPEALVLTNLRKEAIKGLIALDAKNDEAVPYFAMAFDAFFKKTPPVIETDEQLITLDALGVCATDSAATLLRDFLLLLDRQRKDGIYDDTRDLLTKAALRNAGITKNPIVRPALISIKANTMWAGGVISVANEALKKFQ